MHFIIYIVIVIASPVSCAELLGITTAAMSALYFLFKLR